MPQNLQFFIDSPALLIALLIVGTVAWCLYLRIEADRAVWHDDDE